MKILLLLLLSEGFKALIYNYVGLNPMDRGAWQAIVHGVTKVRHNSN